MLAYSYDIKSLWLCWSWRFTNTLFGSIPSWLKEICIYIVSSGRLLSLRVCSFLNMRIDNVVPESPDSSESQHRFYGQTQQNFYQHILCYCYVLTTSNVGSMISGLRVRHIIIATSRLRVRVIEDGISSLKDQPKQSRLYKDISELIPIIVKTKSPISSQN